MEYSTEDSRCPKCHAHGGLMPSAKSGGIWYCAHDVILRGFGRAPIDWRTGELMTGADWQSLHLACWNQNNSASHCAFVHEMTLGELNRHPPEAIPAILEAAA